jgi:hypothetical protein
MFQLKIIKGKYHYIKHEFEHGEYVISHNDVIYYWRPNLSNLGCDYMTISDVQEMISRIKQEKYRSESAKTKLINHWILVHQIMREGIIDKVLEPVIDYNCYILAC